MLNSPSGLSLLPGVHRPICVCANVWTIQGLWSSQSHWACPNAMAILLWNHLDYTNSAPSPTQGRSSQLYCSDKQIGSTFLVTKPTCGRTAQRTPAVAVQRCSRQVLFYTGLTRRLGDKAQRSRSDPWTCIRLGQSLLPRCLVSRDDEDYTYVHSQTDRALTRETPRRFLSSPSKIAYVTKLRRPCHCRFAARRCAWMAPTVKANTGYVVVVQRSAVSGSTTRAYLPVNSTTGPRSSPK